MNMNNATPEQIEYLQSLTSLPLDYESMRFEQAESHIYEFLRDRHDGTPPTERMASPKQIEYLVGLGMPREEAASLRMSEVGPHLDRLQNRPSDKQRAFLRKRGLPDSLIDVLTKAEAANKISYFVSLDKEADQ